MFIFSDDYQNAKRKRADERPLCFFFAGLLSLLFCFSLSDIFLTRAYASQESSGLAGLAAPQSEHAQENGEEPSSGETLPTGGSEMAGGSPEAEGADQDAWYLILVNAWNPLPEDYEIPELTELIGGHRIDSRVYPYLQQMFDDARSQGIYPGINSSYRTREDQQRQVDEYTQLYLDEGYDWQEAYNLAMQWVAVPGTSEHELGLCLDIGADEQSGQDQETVWNWLLENSWKYGFVKRYPEDKTDITGINHEQWHFRFVGPEAAEIMYRENLCLEEYLEIYGKDQDPETTG